MNSGKLPEPEMVEAAIQSWMHQAFPNNIIHRRILGTYGSVYVLEARHENQTPAAIAVKTLDATRARELKCGLDLAAVFRRELGVWMNLPYHRNLLGAIRINIMPVPDQLREKLQYESLPFVMAPYCDATLRDWIKSPPVPGDAATPLIAIACLCNGLCWVYDQGLQGHGDLKPENVLVRDLRHRYSFPPGGYPSPTQPWEIKLADFGWADIWRDLGGTDHAWRPLSSPRTIGWSLRTGAQRRLCRWGYCRGATYGQPPCGQDDSRNWSMAGLSVLKVGVFRRPTACGSSL